MSKRKEYSIPECPQLSKYDGMGSAGANMMYHDRVAKEGHRPGDYTETIEITTVHYHDSPIVQENAEREKIYQSAFYKGYSDAINDLSQIAKISEIDLDRLSESNGGYMHFNTLGSINWKKGCFRKFGLIK